MIKMRRFVTYRVNTALDRKLRDLMKVNLAKKYLV